MSSTTTSFFDFPSSSSSEDETITSLKVNLSIEASIEDTSLSNQQKESNSSIKCNGNFKDNNKMVNENLSDECCIEEKFNNQLFKFFSQMPATPSYGGKSKSTNVLSILTQPDDIEKMILSNGDVIKSNKKNLSISFLPGTGESFTEDCIIKKECCDGKGLQIYNCYEIASAMNLNDYNKKNNLFPIVGNKISAEEVKECKRNDYIYSKLDNIISGFNFNKMLTQSLFLPTSGFSLNDLTGMFYN
uniref:Uncharacterized protein n=1 Tax=Strongyloides papillosus TaxID=174720 RepID=A0A0N5B2X0_STREA